MTRLSWVPVLPVLLLATEALAQQPGQGPPLPIAVDLKKVAVGAWADYQMSVGQMPPMTTRMALVAKNPPSYTVEMIVQGGMVAMAGGKVTVNNSFELAKDGTPTIKKVIMQIAANDPMELPLSATQQGQFRKPDPKTFVKQETIKVAAGTFKTKHYRDKGATGESIDYWISQDVPPFGIVKAETDSRSSTPGAQGPTKLELMARGKDAQPTVTKAARPFDSDTFKNQVTGGGAGKPPASAPPPTSPAPKK